MKIYIKNINDYSEEFYKNKFYELNNYQKNKIKKLRNRDDKKLSLLGLIIVSDVFKIPISKIYYKKGKPFIKKNNYNFSISHKYPHVLVVEDKVNIGADLEIIRNIDKKVISLLDAQNNLEALIKWTRIESKIKNNNIEKSNKTILLNKSIIININS